jgi:hypothetical protein
MAPGTTYTHVASADTNSIPTSPQGFSQASSTSPPGRFTPDLDSEDEEESYVMAGGGEDGYEMAELGTRRTDNDVETLRAAHTIDDGSDPDDEDETWVDRATSRRTSVQSFELYTPDEECAVIRKLDTHLVLFVAL